LSSTQSKASRAKIHLAAPDRLIWVLIAAVIVWGVWAFGSELMLNLRLNRQADALRTQNAQLATSNQQTRNRLAAANSPAALEEAARKQGYARSGEQVYVIVSPSPTVTMPEATPQNKKAGDSPLDAVARWWKNLWH
jgi:cell division protein FtsB